jgi:hypothetical protein
MLVKFPRLVVLGMRKWRRCKRALLPRHFGCGVPDIARPAELQEAGLDEMLETTPK